MDGFYRKQEDKDFSMYKPNPSKSFENEWQNDNRIDESVWIQRYDYESDLVVDIIQENKLKNILEFGSGPGKMSDIIQKKLDYDVSYTMIDKPNAKKIFDERGFKGNFLVKDLDSFVDTEGLKNNYDFIIANDFLEHISNPSYILLESYKNTTDEAKLFVSVPNWRMGHRFIYRGLFDYDNFCYFLTTHGWVAMNVMGSPFNCTRKGYEPAQRLSSETTLPNELLDSWNWYFECSKLN